MPHLDVIEGRKPFGHHQAVAPGKRADRPLVSVRGFERQTWTGRELVLRSFQQSAGQIDFDGDVLIYGNVQRDAVIRASGRVRVGGTVSGAIIMAGGDAYLDDVTDDALITVAGSVHANRLSGVTVEAGESVFVRQAISDSQVRALQTIEVLATLAGTISGGSLEAGRSIRASVLGSPDGRPTRCTVGEGAYLLRRYQEATATLQAENHQLQALNSQIIALRLAGRERHDDRLRVLEARQHDHLAACDCHTATLARLIRALQMAQDAHLVAQACLHAGTIIAVGSRTLELQTTQAASIVRLVDDRVAILPPSSSRLVP